MRRDTGAAEEVAGVALRNLLGRPYLRRRLCRYVLPRDLTLSCREAVQACRPAPEVVDCFLSANGGCYVDESAKLNVPICSFQEVVTTAVESRERSSLCSLQQSRQVGVLGGGLAM